VRYLRQNTATIVTCGQFLDVAGLVLETRLTITNEKISFVVDLNDGSAPTLVLDNVTGATSGTDNDLNYIANCDAALMQLELTQANTNYVGRAFLTITDAANHCPVFHEFTILPAMVYDSLILGTDVLQADMTQILGTAVSTPATAGLLDVNAIQLSGDATAANRLEAVLDAMPSGAVVDDEDPDPTTLLFETNLAEATSDHYNGAFVVFTSGALLGQSRKISDYDGTTKVVTVATAFTEAPAAADAFIILGRSE